MSSLTAEHLRSILSYDRDTGLFTWLVSVSNAAPKAGSIAGCTKGSSGYVEIGIGGKLHKSHRLAWLYVNGEWPTHEVDHVNGIRNDNSWTNLRAASRQQNVWNSGMSSSNTSGFRGVSFDKQLQRWKSQICVNYKKFHLGYFDTLEEAVVSYRGAAGIVAGDWVRPVELLMSKRGSDTPGKTGG